jgi:hypothetical protein
MRWTWQEHLDEAERLLMATTGAGNEKALMARADLHMRMSNFLYQVEAANPTGQPIEEEWLGTPADADRILEDESYRAFMSMPEREWSDAVMNVEEIHNSALPVKAAWARALQDRAIQGVARY